MVSKLLMLATILFLIFPFLFASEQPFSTDDDAEDDNNEDEYVLDNPFSNSRLTSRFLATTIKTIKKGTRCEGKNKDICNGISANNGTSLLNCCKFHCRNVLGDRNNCGTCRHKCQERQRCCGGVCTDIVNNKSHCGKCFKKCKNGKGCQNQFCGYA